MESAEPALAVLNAADPDSDTLTYHFELYQGSNLAGASDAVTENASGITSWTPGSLSDNTAYQWRARAFDGDSYGAWSPLARFTVRLPRASVTAAVDFDPDTLNKGSNGTWVVAYIELPQGLSAAGINVSSVRLKGEVQAELKPFAIGDYDRDGIPDLMVKFRRSEVVSRLATGDRVPVEVTGKVGAMAFERVDFIKVTE